MSKNGHCLKDSPYRGSGKDLIMNTPIKVIVVDHEKDFLSSAHSLLESHLFEVTCVDDGLAALRVLSGNKDQFDLLLVEKELRDVDIHTFLRLAKDMDILSMVMCEEEEDAFLLKAFKNGASLVLKRPLTMEGVVHARQHVIRKRLDEFKTGMEKEDSSEDTITQPIHENDAFSTTRLGVQWTKELHAKFLTAVNELGEGQCFPKKILQTMGVPGLTRMQVASHLQKSRKDGWTFTGKRGRASSQKRVLYGGTNDSRVSGRMPCLSTNTNTNTNANREEILLPAHSSTSLAQESPLNLDIDDPSFPLMDGFDIGDMNSVSGVAQSSSLPPNDLLDMLEDMDVNTLVAYTQMYLLPGLINNSISDVVIPDQDPSTFI